MAYFFYSDNGPDSITVIADMDKIKAASTESFEEYLITNRFGWAPDRINIGDVIHYSLTQGFKANINCLYYHSIIRKIKDRILTEDKFLKYDGLPSATIRIPIVKESVIDVFKKYAPEKIQVVDVVIELQDGTKIYDYKALNVINRVEAFTWEGSKKSRNYKEGCPINGYPNVSSMDIIAFKREIVEKEIVCHDSVIGRSDIMICEALGQELIKHKFKGLRLNHDEAGQIKFI